MRIKDLLAVESIDLSGQASGKNDVLNQMVDLMAKSGKINDVDTYRKGVFAREDESTTGIGEGIAIPHCKSSAVNKPGLAAMVLPNGVDFDALDGEPVNLIFLIAAPNTKDNVHLDVLSKLSTLLMDLDFTNKLKNAKSVDEFLNIIDEAESDKDEQETAKLAAQEGASFSVLAVTACPTGIAHTYMAAESLEQHAKDRNISIKVETRGSGGAKNVLTDQEIKDAKAIIVAADTKVPMERFDGKPVIQVKVADGINKADELLDKVLNGEAPIFNAAESVSESDSSSSSEGAGRSAYKHLMSGVSHMLPFVIGGGIMVALAFLIDTICGYGSSGSGNFGQMVPLSAFFKYVGGLAMGLMVPVLAGYIAYSIADRPGLAVGFVGGMLASSGNASLAQFVNVWPEKLNGFEKFIADFGFAGKGQTVSGFLGGIAAGFVAGFIILLLKQLTKNLPSSLDGLKPTLIYPVFGILLMGIVMCFCLNPLIGEFNTLLNEMLSNLSKANMLPVLGLILGAMMAIDMGGPINKAAYVFGTTMLSQAADLVKAGASQNDPRVQACYVAMAAVMIGGMVPPVGIALSCFLFPKKYTKAEKETKITNLVMGFSFITEGAIPFAAADPLHVIPCTLVGAGVAGCLAAIFKCTLMAPHGGIFVIMTIGKPLAFVISWLIGSCVTAILLGLIKKDAK